MPAEAPIVTLTNVAKTYANGVVAVRDISLAVEAREFLTLLGPSGCGKSTILRLIAGLGSATGGRIEWTGDESRHAARRNIGFVFQEPTLMPWATVSRW